MPRYLYVPTSYRPSYYNPTNPYSPLYRPSPANMSGDEDDVPVSSFPAYLPNPQSPPYTSPADESEDEDDEDDDVTDAMDSTSEMTEDSFQGEDTDENNESLLDGEMQLDFGHAQFHQTGTTSVGWSWETHDIATRR